MPPPLPLRRLRADLTVGRSTSESARSGTVARVSSEAQRSSEREDIGWDQAQWVTAPPERDEALVGETTASAPPVTSALLRAEAIDDPRSRQDTPVVARSDRPSQRPTHPAIEPVMRGFQLQSAPECPAPELVPRSDGEHERFQPTPAPADEPSPWRDPESGYVRQPPPPGIRLADILDDEKHKWTRVVLLLAASLVVLLILALLWNP